MLFIVVPQKAIPELPKGLLKKARKETIVIDVGNYYPFRDGRIDELENGLTESVWVERQIGRPWSKPQHDSLKGIDGGGTSRWK